MDTQKQQIYRLLTSSNADAKLALQLLKGQPKLKKEVEKELLPILQSVGKKTLRGLPAFLKNFDKHLKKAFREKLFDDWCKSKLLRQILASLKEITISYNEEINKLPERITILQKLETLWLIGCSIEEIPASISQLSQLNSISFYNNKLTSIPKSIIQLKELNDITLGKNAITKLPDDIGDLTALTWLDLTGNKLTSLPDSMQNLTKLLQLHIDDNPLPMSEIEKVKKWLPNCVIWS